MPSWYLEEPGFTRWGHAMLDVLLQLIDDDTTMPQMRGMAQTLGLTTEALWGYWEESRLASASAMTVAMSS